MSPLMLFKTPKGDLRGKAVYPKNLVAFDFWCASVASSNFNSAFAFGGAADTVGSDDGT